MELALLDFDNTITNSESIVLKNTIEDIKKYTVNNRICIISNSSFNELKSFKDSNSLSISFYSLTDLIGEINDKVIKANLDFNIVNNIIDKFNDYIYTAWMIDLNKTYIYNYQERLNLFYPKNERVIIDKLTNNISSITIAINNGIYDEFYQYLNEINLEYEIIAKDLKRNIVKIYDKSFNKEIFFKKIINSFNPDKTIGIGDDESNLEFINLCNEKVAMKDSNLANKIKKTTNFDNNHNGCLEYLINR